MAESSPATTTSPHGPKVSVLLPVWNGERYLAGAIESVLGQSFADFELVIVDDGSADGSGALIRGYRDPRIRCLENEKNLGVTRSLNLALERARGRYVARMDADDLCAPERLERQVAFLDTHPEIALVTSRARCLDAAGAEINVTADAVDGELLRRRLRVRNCIVHGSIMVRAEVVRALGGYEEAMNLAEDYDLWLRLSERHEIAMLPDVLYAWRDHAGGVGMRNLPQQNRVAERARLAARRRFCAALIDEVVAGRASAGRAARRAIDLLREEATAFPPEGRRAALAAFGARRAPRLHAHGYALRHLGALVGLWRILRDGAAGRLDPDATCAALVASIRAIDPASREA